MADRVTTAEVKVIFETDLADLSTFIGTADALVDQVAAADSSLSVAYLAEISLWLSAHFAAMRDPREAKSRVGDSSQTFEGKTGMGLQFTRYGQQALLLDTTGTLRKLGKKKARFSYAGREADDGEMKE